MFSKSFEILRIHGKRSSHQNVFTFSRKKRFKIYYLHWRRRFILIWNGGSGIERKNSDQYILVKKDCIGHIQEHMGSNLCKYKIEEKAKKVDDG